MRKQNVSINRCVQYRFIFYHFRVSYPKDANAILLLSLSCSSCWTEIRRHLLCAYNFYYYDRYNKIKGKNLKEFKKCGYFSGFKVISFTFQEKYLFSISTLCIHMYCLFHPVQAVSRIKCSYCHRIITGDQGIKGTRDEKLSRVAFGPLIPWSTLV